MDAPDARQIRPLIFVGNPLVIDEHTVAQPTGTVLKWQCDQVAETSGGPRVLARKEPVVGLKADVGPTLPSRS